MNRIAKLREKKKITQDDFSKKLGISIASLRDYEKGKRAIPSNVLIKIAKILDCSVDFLLGITNYATITVVDKESLEVICSVKGNEIIEHKGYKVLCS